jgi:hypothetical protein
LKLLASPKVLEVPTDTAVALKYNKISGTILTMAYVKNRPAIISDTTLELARSDKRARWAIGARQTEMPVRSVLTQNPDQKELDVQVFVKRPKERLRRVSRGDQKKWRW